MSECFRCPVCSCAPDAQFLAHETAGAARTRHSLRPLFEEAQTNLKKLGQIMPRDRERMSHAVGWAKRSVPTILDNAADRWWAQRKRAFAHPTKSSLAMTLMFLNRL